MAAQYLQSGDELDSLAMSAGEQAIRVLAEHGLVEPHAGGRCARWTEAGRRFLQTR
jgi:hypothetical protein